MDKSLQASSFILCEPSQSMHARDLWALMAHDVCDEFSEQYEFETGWYFRVCLKAEAAYSPDKQFVRYRTMEASIRRKSGRPTLLDLSVGNLYSEASGSPAKPVHIINEPKYSKWARHAGQIPLVEHVRLIRQFAADLMDAGWQLEESALRPIKIPPPLIKNGQGVRLMPTKQFSSLAKSPAEMMSASLDFAVVWPELTQAAWGAEQLSTALNNLLRVDAKLIPRVRKLRKISPEAINLVLLGDGDDLDNMTELRDELRVAEAAGVRFKLAKLSTLRQPYPASNIAFDMFVIAGGKPWVSAEPQPAFCSMDAGHDKEGQRSRWVKVETDVRQAIKSVGVFDTGLAEHLPVALHETMWPSESDAIICRDGRLSQERVKFEERAAADCRPLIEVKKSPKAILWLSSESGVHAAEFGDAVIDVHDEVLLQTVPQKLDDYIHPVRLALQGGDVLDLSTSFLHQHAIPGLSLFRMSRLPGSLYFADLVSKLTAEGWPKVVGRGFNIPRVVP